VGTVIVMVFRGRSSRSYQCDGHPASGPESDRRAAHADGDDGIEVAPLVLSEYMSLYSDVVTFTLERMREPSSEHGHGPVPDPVLAPDDAVLLAERFKLLADASRLRMIYALLEAGELCVSDLAGFVEVSESATSHQLRQLRLAGLVRARKQGREVFYRVADRHVRVLLDVAVEHYLHGHEERR
jgi:DNA-binding transcriptional ArsR family regulator